MRCVGSNESFSCFLAEGVSETGNTISYERFRNEVNENRSDGRKFYLLLINHSLGFIFGLMKMFLDIMNIRFLESVHKMH